jgi:acetate kinase
MRVLVVNAGSSSLKLSVLDGERPVVDRSLLAAGVGTDAYALREVVEIAGRIDAVGHRIVHGGVDFTGPTRIDEPVRRRLEALTDLAPLHQPRSLAALDAVTSVLPDVPAVASFDTAFHATIPAAASTYALPPEWRRRWPLRRFGFHGLSHAYAARRVSELADLAGRRTGLPLRVVCCHLGAGASVAAIHDGVSVDTTMGFTPLEGLVMATRSGSVDPGLVLWLEEHAGMPPAELASTLEHRSGLLGLAGSSDMRAVLEAESGGDADASLAIEVYLHRLRAAIAAMAAAMDGLDVLVFTGGVGEHSPEIRQRVADGLGFLGIEVDPALNSAGPVDGRVEGAGAATLALVIRAREDLQIAGEVGHVLG